MRFIQGYDEFKLSLNDSLSQRSKNNLLLKLLSTNLLTRDIIAWARLVIRNTYDHNQDV